MRFAERMGFEDSTIIQINSISDRLRARLYNFYKNYTNHLYFDEWECEDQIFWDAVDYLGIIAYGNQPNYIKIDEIFLDKFKESHWYTPYEIIEFFLKWEEKYGDDSRNWGQHRCSKDELLKIITSEYNCILEEEHSGYRICNNELQMRLNWEKLRMLQILPSKQ